LIAATLWLTPYFTESIMALAWSVFFAGIFQLLFQLPFLHRLHLLPTPRLDWHDEGVRRILRLMIPALFGVSVSQVNLLIDTLMASFLVTGSVSWLYYSDRLVEFPLGIFGLALATVILPNLSRSVARHDTHTYSTTLDWALRWTFLIVTPSMIGLVILAGPILVTLFYRGEFNERDVHMTTLSLMGYSVGLLGFVLTKVLASGFYARQDIRTPVYVAVIAMVTNIVLNLIFIIPFKHAGLALATSLAAILNAWLLYRNLRKRTAFQLQPGWRNLLLQVIIANSAMALLLGWGCGSLSTWFTMSSQQRVLYLSGWIIVGAVTYFVSLVSLGLRLAHLNLAQE
jgi:putative peptidoglycan lipid II flippase